MYKTNLEGGTLCPCIRLHGYQPWGGPTGPALRLIPSLILGLILDLVLPSQLVLYYIPHVEAVLDVIFPTRPP